MELYIIRHGETAWNTVRRLQGQTDIPLNEEGVRLASLTAKNLSVRFDKIYSSPLTRARQTAAPFAEKNHQPVILDDRLMEISFGDWEGEPFLTSPVLGDSFRKDFLFAPLSLAAPPGGESFPDVIKRTGEFYQALLSDPENKDKTILLSTHGAASRCLLYAITGPASAPSPAAKKELRDISLWRGCVPPNCAVSHIRVTDTTPVLLELDALFGRR